MSTTILTDAPPARRVVCRRQWGAWIFGGLVLLALAMIVRAGVSAKVIDVSVFASYIFSKNTLIGAGNSLMPGTVALLLAVLVGLIVAMMRVSARPLAMQPGLMLPDEPTSALDPELSHEVIAAIRQLAEDSITWMIATCEMALARHFADRVLFMVSGELVEDRPAHDFFSNPLHERAREFLSKPT